VANINDGLAKSLLEYGRAEKGIRDPRVTILQPGEDLYRFTSSRLPGSKTPTPFSRQVHGPWWFRSRDWQKVLLSYLSGRFSLGTVARIAGAVQWSWSDMDVLLKARVVDPIEAWEGHGRPQYRDVLPNGMAVTLTGFPNIVQLYIPGMPAASAGLRLIDRISVASTNAKGDATGGPHGGPR